ncbi:methionyl-tRNA formyltransferase [Candidatus Pacearchaeota archaeon CG10_big_fil_rev_8_21_14_0_10_34_76]|nr:MAG: methionyl-tRNA formyltransferase [Candidatus Pacearchaeota archaeon CG10_big_fil_rev_8_21_14_0_10_34_76]
MPPKYKVVGFLARQHGLEGLKSIMKSEKYDPLCVFTHRMNPTSENPSGEQRDDFKDFESLTRSHGIPLYAVDSKNENRIVYGIFRDYPIDLILSISWRRLIPLHQLRMAKYGGLNIHRGKLPEYAGALPIHRALRDCQKNLYVTAHVLSEEIDGGEILDTIVHPVNYNPEKSLEENIERLKREISPHMGELSIRGLDKLLLRK